MAEKVKPGATQPTILVVDDDPGVRTVVARGLQLLNPATVLEVANGLEAQKVLSERPVDVVVTDVLMPVMDGRELMRWAREHCPGPLWIVLSGLDTFDAAVEALHLGAFDFLSKPLVLQRVRVAVRNALEHQALTRERERLYAQIERSNAELARKVADLEHVCRMLEDQAEVIQADLARAEVIQRALLPQAPPKLSHWCVETLYRPGSNVGGDFYDVVQVDERHLGLVIADAAGHGVAAAMLSVLFKHRLKLKDEESQTALMPNEVLRKVNRSLHADLSAPGAFITAAYVLVDRPSGRVSVASAGHPPCILASRDGQTRMLARTGPALGLEADARYEQTTMEMGVGDRLLIYTDGVLEGGASSPCHADLARGLMADADDRATLLSGFYEAARRDPSHDPDDITMILLERGDGISRFDDDVGMAQACQAAPAPLRLLQATSGRRAFISIAGTATWMRSEIFCEAARKALGRRRELIIDLGACEYLDSTFLGTLYEVVMISPERVRLQRVPTKVRALFEELSMSGVLSRASLVTEPLPPDMKPLRDPRSVADLQGERVLKAHEILASLSDENQEQFRDVIEALRSDLAAARSAH